MNIERFSESCGEGGGVYEDTDGDYVLAADYDALAVELARWQKGSAIRDEALVDAHALIKEQASRFIELEISQRRVAELEAELQALKAAQQWIPVSERLPENDTPILVAYKFGGIYTCRRNVIDHDLTAVDPAHGERDRPTHWMPLPAGPHEGKSHE